MDLGAQKKAGCHIACVSPAPGKLCTLSADLESLSGLRQRRTWPDCAAVRQTSGRKRWTLFHCREAMPKKIGKNIDLSLWRANAAPLLNKLLSLASTGCPPDRCSWRAIDKNARPLSSSTTGPANNVPFFLPGGSSIVAIRADCLDLASSCSKPVRLRTWGLASSF